MMDLRLILVWEMFVDPIMPQLVINEGLKTQKKQEIILLAKKGYLSYLSFP